MRESAAALGQPCMRGAPVSPGVVRWPLSPCSVGLTSMHKNSGMQESWVAVLGRTIQVR